MAVLLLSPLSPVSAAVGDNVTEEQKAAAQESAAAAKDTAIQAAEEAGVTYEQFKAKYLALLDEAIERLELAEQRIQANPYLTSTTKNELVKDLNEIENGLERYKAEVEKTTSMTDLEGLTQEIIAYLKANKTVIQETIKSSVLVLMGEIDKTANAIVEEAESVLAQLKRTCPEQEATITKVQGEVDQLQALEDQLAAAIKAEDVETAKSIVAQMRSIIPTLAKEIKTLYQACY